MTRREALLALAVIFVMFTAGITWLAGPLGLIGCAIAGAAAVIFCFERVEPRGEAVSDAVPDPLLAAFERDFSL